MQKLKERRIQVISPNGQSVAPQVAPKKTFSFWGLFSSSKSNSHSHSVLLRETPFKKNPPIAPKTDLDAIRSWVALEERIVHDYKAHKAVPMKPVALFGKPPAQEKAPSFETLSVQTVTSVPSAPEKVKKPSSEGKRSFFRWGTAVLALGWMLAGLFAYFYAGEISLRQGIALKLAESQGENEQLGWSAAVLNTTASDQRKELQKLDVQIRTMAGALGEAQSKAAIYTAMERAYREELLQVTTHYEEQLDGMRKLVQVRDELVKTLQAHIQTIEKLFSEGGLTNAFIAAAKAVEDQKKKAAEEAAQAAPQQKVLPQGEVVMVNRQYQFIVINLGAEQGAVSGGLVNVSQDGKLFARVRLERVYPSMSAGTVLDDGALAAIKEGDGVSFSSN